MGDLFIAFSLFVIEVEYDLPFNPKDNLRLNRPRPK